MIVVKWMTLAQTFGLINGGKRFEKSNQITWVHEVNKPIDYFQFVFDKAWLLYQLLNKKRRDLDLI